MATRRKDIRELLILAGIDEINESGISEFSVRKVAERCNVSCAAPYKHFKNKQDFMAAIIDYVNTQWRIHQAQILEQCGSDLRSQMVEISVNYIKFLMENPHFRSILMLKDEGFDNLYHKKKGQLNSQSQDIMEKIRISYGYDDDTWHRKVLLIRSLIFGSVFLFDNTEFDFNEKALNHIRYIIDREFDIL